MPYFPPTKLKNKKLESIQSSFGIVTIIISAQSNP